MARQVNQSRGFNTSLLAMNFDHRYLPHPLLYLHIIDMSERSLGAMKYIPTCASIFCLQQRPTCVNSSSACLRLWPSTLVLSATYHYHSCHLVARSLIRVTQQLTWRSQFWGLAPCLLIIMMDWAITQTCSHTLLSICCVVKPPLSGQIPIVSAAHWLTSTLVFCALTQCCVVRNWIVLALVTTDFDNQQVLHYILGSQWWPMIEWWISNACDSKQASGMSNMS